MKSLTLLVALSLCAPYAGLASEAAPSPSAPSAANGKIVFLGASGITVMDADGRNQVAVASISAPHNTPTWSPDGTKIAFSGGRDSHGEDIYVMNPDGSGIVNLTNSPTFEIAPAWSPDGSRIAYARDGDLYVMKADGTGQTKITATGEWDGNPAWSPDGSRIAFDRHQFGVGTQLYVMNADGSDQKNISNYFFSDADPDWSPDGTKLLFTRAVQANFELAVMSPDGSGQTLLTDNSVTEFEGTWSPDGAKIVFIGQNGLNVMNADGTGRIQINTPLGFARYPDWQPLPSAPPTSPVVQFDAAAYAAGEGSGRAVVTLTRAGDTSAPFSVTFQTADDPAAVPCDPAARQSDGTPYPRGAAYARCDYATTIETVSWAAGDVQPKTVHVPLVDDGHAEGAEVIHFRLVGPSGAVLGAQRTATLTITDNDAAGAANPISASPFFVRMHYLDFLSREPEAGEPWTGVLDRCPNVNNTDANSTSAGCDRLKVSQSFFESPEFQLKGLYAYFFYRVAFNRRPAYEEIIADMRSLAGATPEEVFARRAAHVASITKGQEFNRLYIGRTNEQYVDALLGKYNAQQITTEDPANFEGTAQVTLTKQQLIDALFRGALTRGQVLRAVVQSNEVDAAEYHGAFVAMQYYGYLRRAPEQSGYDAWLRVIRQDPNNVRQMVDGFVNSQEYRLRFGPQ